MRICYLLPILQPKLPAAEALSQEISALRQQLGGDLLYLNPNAHLPLPIPRLFFGWHLLPALWQRARALDLYHFYNPEPFAYPVLRWLGRPVIYSLTGSVPAQRPNVAYFNALAAVTVLDEVSRDRLLQWGVRNVYLVRPGIAVERFTHQPLPWVAGGQSRLLMASAPWTHDQFASKGIDALLAAAQRRPNLHLTFLWRGLLAAEMQARVAQLRLQQQVQVIDQLVDVNQVLAGVHAAVVLATHGGLVKAYPHSLLDALAAGKPVLVSRALPMAAYVESTGCGTVVEAVNVEALLAALDQLLNHYATTQQVAQSVGQRDFTEAKMVARYREVYIEALL